MHQHINLRQINQQNAQSLERPAQTASLSTAVELKSKISKNQVVGSKAQASGHGNQSGAGGQAHNSRYDEQTSAMTRSQEPPMNRTGKNHQQRGQKNQTGIKQLVLEDPMTSNRMVMPPISNTMKKTHQVENERQARHEQKIRQQLQQRQNILAQLRNDIFGDEQTTRFGNIVCNAFWGFWPTDEERYVNPKMEDELIIFKKKIKQRFENRDIAKSFQFPRIGSTLHTQIQNKYNKIELQGNKRESAKSQERERLDREMLMTLQAQAGHRNMGKVRNQSQQQTVKQNYSNKLKNPTGGKVDLTATAGHDAQHEINPADLQLRVEFQGAQVDIAELPEDVQKVVIEHLMQKNSDQIGELGQENRLNQTDFVQISELISPAQKQQIKELDQNTHYSGTALAPKSQNKSQKNLASSSQSKTGNQYANNSHSTSNIKALPKVQNFVKNADRQQTGGHIDPKTSQPMFQNVQVMNKGQNSQFKQNSNLNEQASGYIHINQIGMSEAGSQKTHKKKMQNLQPSQNQMKKNAQQALVAQGENAQRNAQSQLQYSVSQSQQQFGQAQTQHYQYDGARKLADSVKVLNSEKKKAREGQPLNSHSAMQHQYQSHDLVNTQLTTANAGADHQQKQRFKDSTANRTKQQQRGSSHEMNSTSNQFGGVKMQGGTQKLNIAELMSPITNAHIQAPTSKKSRSGAQAVGLNHNIASSTHRNANSQLSQSKRPQQVSRNSRAKLSKQSNYSNSINNPGAAASQQQNAARSASNQRTTGPKQKFLSTTGSNMNNPTTKSSLTLMKTQDGQKSRGEQISINSGQIQIEAGVHGNLGNQMGLVGNVGGKGTVMMKKYQQYTQKHKDVNNMVFSQLDFGLSQVGPNSGGHQKIPSKKKPINQSLPLGSSANANNSTVSQQFMSAAGQHPNLNYASNVTRSQHDSLNQAGVGAPKKHGLFSPDRAATGSSGVNAHAGRQNNPMLFAGGNLPATQYASQGASQAFSNDSGPQATMKGLQKVQQIQSNQKQYIGKSPYTHKMYNTTQQTQSVQRGKVIQMQQQKGPQVMTSLRSHTSGAVSQSQSALKTSSQPKIAQEDGGAARTMTQMTAIQNKGQKGPVQNVGHRQSSKDSNKLSQRSHRSHASQTQYAGGYNNGQSNNTQSINESVNLAQHGDGKPRNQAQYGQLSMNRNQFSEMSSAGHKVKRTHNSQRARNGGQAQNFSQKQFYTTQQFGNLASASSQAVFKSSNPQVILSQQAGKNVSSNQQRKNLQMTSDISGHKYATTQLKPTNIAAKAIMNQDGRQRSRNPPGALQGHAQSHTALLTSSLSNAQAFPNPGTASTMELMQLQDQYKSNPSQQQARPPGVTMSNQTHRPVSSTQRSNMKGMQAAKALKTTLSKSQVEARGVLGATREASHSSELPTTTQNYHNQQIPQSNQMTRADSLTQSFNQAFKNSGGGHLQVTSNVQQQPQPQGGVPGGTQTAHLQGIAKLIEPGSNDLPTGAVEYTQSKYRKRLNQQQSHDYQTGMPINLGGGPKGKLAVQASVAAPSRVTKKLAPTQPTGAGQPPQKKLASSMTAPSQSQRTHGQPGGPRNETSGSR